VAYYDRRTGLKKQKKLKAQQAPSKEMLVNWMEQQQEELEASQQPREAASQAEVAPMTSLQMCPGAASTCDYDKVHRVCAQLLDDKGQPLNWGSHGNFWDITDVGGFKWDNAIRSNGGDSWCIDMWQTSQLIKKVGCENVRINCAATDVQYVLDNYWGNPGSDEEENLGAFECLAEGCTLPQPAVLMNSPDDKGMDDMIRSVGVASAGGGALGAVVAAASLAMRRRAFAGGPSEPMLG
jgi:hypothetical protein